MIDIAPSTLDATYGIMYGMKKTTLYLPDELKERVETVARAAGRSEADVIRDAIAVAVAVQRAPDPRIPLPGMSLGDPTVAERAGELLDGFGE
jgi:Ribbon-helix-helix protein, copG family